MWGTQKRGQFTFDLGDRASRGVQGSLRDQLLAALTGEFGTAVVEAPAASIAPDICLKVPGKDGLAVVELKIGDPSLPLPSSTTAQMRRLVDSMSTEKVGPPLASVVVTNYVVYVVNEDQEKDLAANKIKLVRLDSKQTPTGLADEVKAVLTS